MNEAVEIHDSTFAGIEYRGDDLVVHLRPAWIHRSEGKPGVDPGSCWTRNVDLIVSAGIADPAQALTDNWLGDGRLRAGVATRENGFPIPMSAPGPIVLQLMSRIGEWIEIRGDSISIIPVGEAEYRGEFGP